MQVTTLRLYRQSKFWHLLHTGLQSSYLWRLKLDSWSTKRWFLIAVTFSFSLYVTLTPSSLSFPPLIFFPPARTTAASLMQHTTDKLARCFWPCFHLFLSLTSTAPLLTKRVTLTQEKSCGSSQRVAYY